MRVRFITTCALGLAAALSLANTLAAQQTQDTTKLRTTSQTRINISKGEVVTPRVDTVYVTRYDTVTNTVSRIDTVTVTPAAPLVIPKVKGPFYWGAYAGPSNPYGNIDRVYTNGFHAGGVLGWEAQNAPIGLRFDGSVNQLGKEQGSWSTVNQGSGTSLLLQLGADAKVNAIMVRGWSLYGIGGLNFYRHKRIALATNAEPGETGCEFEVRGECFENANNTSWDNKLGFNFGLGTDFHIGSQDMFLEARYLAIQNNGARSYVLPISLGVRYF